MAKLTLPNTLPFKKFLMRVYDPLYEKWSEPCGFTSKGLVRSVSLQETIVPYCENPDAVAETKRKKDAKSTQFTGNGIAALEDHAMWERYYDDDDSWNVRIEMAVSRLKGGGWYEGYMVLANATFNVDRGKELMLDVDMQSDGAMPWIPAPA